MAFELVFFRLQGPCGPSQVLAPFSGRTGSGCRMRITALELPAGFRPNRVATIRAAPAKDACSARSVGASSP